MNRGLRAAASPGPDYVLTVTKAASRKSFLRPITWLRRSESLRRMYCPVRQPHCSVKHLNGKAVDWLEEIRKAFWLNPKPGGDRIANRRIGLGREPEVPIWLSRERCDA
jgi:hypothetical protein